MEMRKLCIFDLDGTLLDTLRDLHLSLSFALKQKDLPSKTLFQTRSYIGNGIVKLVERAIPDEKLDMLDEVVKMFKEHYDAHCNDHTALFPGIYLMLRNLKRAGYKTAIISNKNDEAVQILKNIYFKDLIDIAQGVSEGIKPKPNPDTINKIIDQLKVDKNNTIYIGDSLVDVESANNASLDYLVVSWGYGDLNGIEKDKIVKSSVELESKIKELKPIEMDVNEILKHCDHTLLAQGATLKDIYALCDDAIKYKTASVCIPPYYVKAAKNYVKDKMKVCTVIGFPNGYNTLRTKVFETKDAIKNGADEIDMVVNIGLVKDKKYEKIVSEINAIKKACQGKTLKVIIETCLLTRQEKVRMCKCVTRAGADYIKTSTGFSTAGATKEDIMVFKKFIGENVKIKAAGGIRTLEAAQDFLNLGCDRLGTSSIVKIVKEAENNA